jgi:hypothetical protein
VPPCGAALCRYATEVRIREVKEDRLGKVIVPVNPPSNGAKASLHTTQRLCIEVRVDEDDPPVGYKVGMAPPLHLHVARRDRDKRSYHPTEQFTFWPPHTADSLGVQLATFTGIPAADLRVCRFLRKSRTWDQVVPVVAVPQANSQQKRKPRGTARVGKARKKGASKGAGKKLQLRVSCACVPASACCTLTWHSSLLRFVYPLQFHTLIFLHPRTCAYGKHTICSLHI